MDNDDLPIGRILDRREALKLLAMSGAAVLVGCQRSSAAASDSIGSATAAGAGSAQSGSIAALPACVVRPELTEGPYFVDKQLNRSDIRTEPGTGVAKAGVPLAVAFNVSQVRSGQCVPLAGAMVDIWQCDADGVYSGVVDRGVGNFNTVGQQFLRGHQVTDAKGVARFTTIYPGWYPGRTVHVHFKVRAPYASGAQVTAAGKQYDFTSQLFFDDALNEKVLAQPPYNSKGARRGSNASDGIYRESGETLLLKLAETGGGYSGVFDIGLDLSKG